MRIIIGLFFLFIISIIFIIAYRRKHDFFHPICFFTFFQGLRYLPSMFFVQEELYVKVDLYSVISVFCVEIVCLVSVILGYYVSTLFIKKNNTSYKNLVPSKYLLLILFFIGFLSRIYIIDSVGGVSYIISNVSDSYISITKNNGYILSLSNLMVISIFMYVRYYHIRISDKVVSYGMLIIYCLSYLVFTSRTPVMECLLVIFCVYNFTVKKLDLKFFLRPQVVIIIVICAILIVVLPTLRLNSLSSNKSSSSFNLVNSIESFFGEFSALGKDSFIYKNFDSSNYWYGRNYLNIFTSFIPSSLYPNKPPVDDGMYLSNLILGYKINPSMGRDDLVFQSSIPFSTQGCLYINFGIFGVIIGEFIIGFVYGLIYEYTVSRRSPFVAYIYFIVIYVLELSTLSIIQALTPLAICFICYFLMKFFNKGFTYVESYENGEYHEKNNYLYN